VDALHPPQRRNPPVVFLADYDMLMAERLVQGVDVWINTPRRPWEASGTSGMKVLVNGGINLSELDGWWAEAYMPEVGWALGDGQEHGDDPAWDAAEAEALYERLEQEVIPEFYARNEKGIPAPGWRDPGEHGAADAQVRRQPHRVRIHRAALSAPSLHFGALNVQNVGGQHVIRVDAFLGDIDPGSIRVELYADGRNGGGAERLEMTRMESTKGPTKGFVYSATLPSARPASDYTAQIVPRRDGLAVPLEAAEILWQK
jgi:glycogen phosphorylase